MFIVTADIVKPINRDEVPALKGVDNLKSGSPLLGVEPKDGGISGVSGFSTAPAPTPNGPAESEKKPAAPTTAAVPVTANKSNPPQ